MPHQREVADTSKPPSNSSKPPPDGSSREQEPPVGDSTQPVDPKVLYEFIQPRLLENLSYTQLATLVGRQLGHQYTVLLEAVASTYEVCRKEKKSMPQIYSSINEVHGHKFGSYVLALSKLPLSSDRSFIPNWKNLILNSKPGSTTQRTTPPTSPPTSVATGGQPILDVDVGPEIGPNGEFDIDGALLGLKAVNMKS